MNGHALPRLFFVAADGVVLCSREKSDSPVPERNKVRFVKCGYGTNRNLFWDVSFCYLNERPGAVSTVTVSRYARTGRRSCQCRHRAISSYTVLVRVHRVRLDPGPVTMPTMMNSGRWRPALTHTFPSSHSARVRHADLASLSYRELCPPSSSHIGRRAPSSAGEYP